MRTHLRIALILWIGLSQLLTPLARAACCGGQGSDACCEALEPLPAPEPMGCCSEQPTEDGPLPAGDEAPCSCELHSAPATPVTDSAQGQPDERSGELDACVESSDATGIVVVERRRAPPRRPPPEARPRHLRCQVFLL